MSGRDKDVKKQTARPPETTKALSDESGELLSVARRFQLRLIELAKEGRLGSLKTRKASLQNAYALLLSLLDNPVVPILMSGEAGTGKRRHVKEFHALYNFYRRLEGKGFGQLKIYRADFVRKGFSQKMLGPQAPAADVIYFEGIESLSLGLQDEFLQLLKLRQEYVQNGVAQPRLFVGTDRALSLLVLNKRFRRELFQALSSFAIFLPSLNERPEDLPQIIQDLATEISEKEQIPPAFLVDLFSHRLLPGNLNDLKKVLRNGLAEKAELRSWTADSLPPSVQRLFAGPGNRRFDPAQVVNATKEMQERAQLKQALLAAGGDREKAARGLRLTKTQLLERLVALGLR